MGCMCALTHEFRQERKLFLMASTRACATRPSEAAVVLAVKGMHILPQCRRSSVSNVRLMAHCGGREELAVPTIGVDLSFTRIGSPTGAVGVLSSYQRYCVRV